MLKRLLEIAYERRLSHLGSCITALPIIAQIYKEKKRDERFVLSQGHAGLALYVVLEQFGYDAYELLDWCGVHPDRSHIAIDCSTGSLGQGLPIAVGMALADRTKNVYCLISDGEAMEGAVIEALRIAYEQKLNNLLVFVNANGYGATREINFDQLKTLLNGVGFPVMMIKTNSDLWCCKGIDSHYHIITKEEMDVGKKILG
jgi:transketolase